MTRQDRLAMRKAMLEERRQDILDAAGGDPGIVRWPAGAEAEWHCLSAALDELDAETVA